MPNPQGLHARPAQLLVATANRFRAEVRVRHGEVEANGKSILDVMTLIAPQGALLRFEAEGEDAEEALRALADVVRRGFDEM